MRVLLVEDHAELADTVATGLRREGIAVDVALDGNDALARRSGVQLPPVLVHGDLRVDSANRLASRDGQRLSLSPKELAVLEYLLGAHGRVVSAEELLEHVWDENADPFTTTVKVTIKRLRAKLGAPPLIETVPRGGYRI
jgi:DNA-binding response OmpR family regulator